jgi:hypothetical protein
MPRLVPLRPNDLRISCGPSCRRPHKPTFRNALKDLRARAGLDAYPARRLHARVRQRRAELALAHPGTREDLIMGYTRLRLD